MAKPLRSQRALDVVFWMMFCNRHVDEKDKAKHTLAMLTSKHPPKFTSADFGTDFGSQLLESSTRMGQHSIALRRENSQTAQYIVLRLLPILYCFDAGNQSGLA